MEETGTDLTKASTSRSRSSSATTHVRLLIPDDDPRYDDDDEWSVTPRTDIDVMPGECAVCHIVKTDGHLRRHLDQSHHMRAKTVGATKKGLTIPFNYLVCMRGVACARLRDELFPAHKKAI